MILVYIDETGNRGRKTATEHDWLYAVTAVTLFDQRWHAFNRALDGHKRMLLRRIEQRAGIRLELSDCEIKSNFVRMPSERARHPLLGRLAEQEVTELVDAYYEQLGRHHMHIFSVLVDKRTLPDYMDQEKIHRKSWELLLEQVEGFMSMHNRRHLAMMICDDIGPQANTSLAMKHAYLLGEGTRKSTLLKHICEMPMFVRSELSNGVQLADLCSYNIYRAFSRGDLDYPYFRRIVPHIWSGEGARGLYVLPGDSPVRQAAGALARGAAPESSSGAGKMVSSGANPIEPACGTGRMSETKPDERKSPPATPLVNSQQGNTLLLSPASPSPSDPAIVRAADLLASGRLVAFPTETVYGLGADATNACASAEIFEAKGRPSSNPVIVHVADAGAARALAVVWPPAAEVLAAAFWPGPLTLVVESVAAIAPGVRAGGPTVGLRVPAHPVALALLRACGKPIAAPSANRSMRISPTTAQAVLDELGGRIEAVLDGGPCDVGIESTVVDVTGGRVRVLRPGMIGAGVIARVAGDLSAGERSSGPARSPGQMLRHYAPRIPLRLVPEGGAPDGAFVIARTGAAGLRRAVLPAEPAGFARELYAALRAAESSGAGEIALELPPAAPEWAAIHDRLRRAAAADPTQ